MIATKKENEIREYLGKVKFSIKDYEE